MFEGLLNFCLRKILLKNRKKLLHLNKKSAIAGIEPNKVGLILKNNNVSKRIISIKKMFKIILNILCGKLLNLYKMRNIMDNPKRTRIL